MWFVKGTRSVPYQKKRKYDRLKYMFVTAPTASSLPEYYLRHCWDTAFQVLCRFSNVSFGNLCKIDHNQQETST